MYPLAVYDNQLLPLMPILLETKRLGICTNQQEIEKYVQQFEALTLEAGNIAAVYCGVPFNLNSSKALQAWLYEYEKFPVQKKAKRPTTDKDAIAELCEWSGFPTDPEKKPSVEDVLARIKLGANPVLEAVRLWSRADQLLTAYLYKMRSVSVIYPDQAIHAQKSGRWSTTDPPIAQLPKDMRGILQPFPGYCWLSWDLDQAELRVLAALSRSKFLIECFENNWDIHTLTACTIFGLPVPPDKLDPHKAPSCVLWRAAVGWQGKDDPRRVFAKRGRYKLNYGGDYRSKVPGSKFLGLKQAALETALQTILYSDPDLLRWRAREASQVAKTGRSVTFMGRVLRIMSTGSKRERQGYDHPMQGAVTDITNTTDIQIKRTLPYLTFSWHMHDSRKWNCPLGKEKEAQEIVQQIVDQEWDIGGVLTKIHGEVEIVYREDRK